jgi:ParB family chromosome partitioning protein
LVREADDRTLLTLALVENLQRDSVSPIDEALGYRRLLAEFGLTQQQIAETVGRDRSTVANAVRLLRLPDQVQALVHEGKLSVGHARALVTLEDAELVRRLAGQAVANQWSVREMEARAKPGPRQRRRPRKTADGNSARSPEERQLEDGLRRRLQTDVRLVLHGEKGRIEIAFYSNDDLARVTELILGAPFA